MSSVIPVVVDDETMAKRIERRLYRLEDVVWAFGGSETLVAALRKVGVLRGKIFGKTLFFLAADVADAAGRWLAGEYDELLDSEKR